MNKQESRWQVCSSNQKQRTNDKSPNEKYEKRPHTPQPSHSHMSHPTSSNQRVTGILQKATIQYHIPKNDTLQEMKMTKRAIPPC